MKPKSKAIRKIILEQPNENASNLHEADRQLQRNCIETHKVVVVQSRQSLHSVNNIFRHYIGLTIEIECARARFELKRDKRKTNKDYLRQIHNILSYIELRKKILVCTDILHHIILISHH